MPAWTLAGAVRELVAELSQLQGRGCASPPPKSKNSRSWLADVQRRVAAGDLASADALAAQAEHLAAQSQHT